MTCKKVCVIVLLMIVSSTTFSQKDHKIMEAETLRFKAMMTKDSAALVKSVDDGLIYIHSNGIVQDKKAFLESIKSGTFVYQSIEPKERQCRIYGKSAIINGIVHVKGMVNGNAFEINLRYTDVLVNKKGWRTANWQSLKID